MSNMLQFSSDSFILTSCKFVATSLVKVVVATNKHLLNVEGIKLGQWSSHGSWYPFCGGKPSMTCVMSSFQFTFAGTLLSKSGGWILFPGLRIMLRSGIQVGSKAKLNRNHNQQGHNLWVLLSLSLLWCFGWLRPGKREQRIPGHSFIWERGHPIIVILSSPEALSDTHTNQWNLLLSFLVFCTQPKLPKLALGSSSF